MGREKLLAMTTTDALRLHLSLLSSAEVDDEFGKLVHPGD